MKKFARAALVAVLAGAMMVPAFGAVVGRLEMGGDVFVFHDEPANIAAMPGAYRVEMIDREAPAGDPLARFEGAWARYRNDEIGVRLRYPDGELAEKMKVPPEAVHWVGDGAKIRHAYPNPA
ncbi:hypothetical protein QF001_003781 [Paraburkholderia youngii]|uniref:hypothetical protein n=1 Tax=Paraburkholderia youngii TaxID=2782701 RepID=UPI003D1DEA35